MERTIRHPVIGDITVKKKIGNRNIRITVHPTKGVNVSIPWFTRFSTAERFIFEREEWIISSINKQKTKREKSAVILGEGNPFHTIKRTICFFEIGQGESAADNKITPANNKIKVVVRPGEGKIIFPKESTREELIVAVEKILRYDAKKYLPQRTKELAEKFGFKYNKIFLKNNKTNWGSCSKLKNLNLNIHLMRLTIELADYVILHELCHLKHHNHGPEFHKFLNNLCEGKERFYAKQLRSIRTNI